MIIRQGTTKEMRSLWYKRNTSEFFETKINNGTAEFWTIEMDEELIGELYIFKKLNDIQFADGTTTAYLCAFRITQNHRRKGFGTMLMNTVLNHIRRLGYKYVTIGAEVEEIKNIQLYKRLGFKAELGKFDYDPCDVDENYSPLRCKQYILLRKTLS